MDDWYRKNNIAEKLRVAIEDLHVGGGLPVAFRGLETGVCMVDVVYNGENICFVNKMPAPEPVVEPVVEEAEIVVGDAGEPEITMPPDAEASVLMDTFEEVEEKPKRRRRKKQVESSES